jgi:hypothetical protein
MRLRNFAGVIGKIEKVRFTEDGKLFTTAGITSGLDSSLHVVELINRKGMATSPSWSNHKKRSVLRKGIGRFALLQRKRFQPLISNASFLK